MIETNNDMPFNTALKWVLFIAALFLLNFLGRIIFGPLMPVIREELGLTHAQAGSIFLMIGVGNAAGLLCNGLVSRRLGHRRTVALCSLLVGLASLLVSTSTDFSGIRSSLCSLASSPASTCLGRGIRHRPDPEKGLGQGHGRS
ncbi:MFS transporter [Salidesulfovibrio brasiliensis]|uniref:MFS transporter n=1 Tax=Salidesulfovibrio brasiliensis TaxID=221711 RepID=UPI0006D11F76|nr:MFS transporter [Salidesulfovibrio brasiliensis]